MVARPLRAALAGVRDVLLPPLCPLCGRDLPPESRRDSRCDECHGTVPLISEYCRRCSSSAGPYIDTTNGCGHCRRERYAFDSAYSAADYQGLLRSAVLAAKQSGGGPAAAWLSDLLWNRRGDELRTLPIDVVTSVPQHWTRRILAPHCAAELIGRRLAARLKVPFDAHILVKTRRTPRQATLPPSARRNNLRSAFIAARRLDGKRVLLTDDVLTTGTTAHRASRALLRAGAEIVWVAAPARAVGH